MLSSKNSGIVLPDDVVQEMFMNYCDYQILCNTRDLQSTRVRRCTQFNDMEEAIVAGNLVNVKWIARNDKWKKKSDKCLRFAARGGHLECLKWLFHALGRSYGNEGGLHYEAAKGGHLEICIWLMENGYFNQKAFNGVVLAGNVEMMEWCEQNGAVFDDKTFYVAAHSGKIEALEWLKLNECPWGCLSLQRARNKHANSNVLNWLQTNGCPEN